MLERDDGIMLTGSAVNRYLECGENSNAARVIPNATIAVLERDKYIMFTVTTTPPLVPDNNSGERTHARNTMPRKYIRKREVKYRIEDLQKAIEDVRNKKLSLNRAAAKYSVPKTTIFDRLNKSVVDPPKTGRKRTFTTAQESELEEYLIKCSKLFYGLTIKKFRRIVYQFAEWKQLPHIFDRKKQAAGKDWYYSFIKRHPRISMSKPDPTSLKNVDTFNEADVKLYYNNLKSIQNKYQFPPEKIFNVDESAISTVQIISTICTEKSKNQFADTSAEGLHKTTVINALSAAGQYIPPFFIFKTKQMNSLLLNGSNPDMVGAISDSGLINQRLFVDWLHHFIYHTKPSKDHPILLILDGHESHVSVGAYTMCKNNGIIMLTLPPHTSHKLQPLNLAFYESLKNAYYEECENYMTDPLREPITQYNIVELFTNAFNRSSDIEKAANGFKLAGIYPFKPVDVHTNEPHSSQSCSYSDRKQLKQKHKKKKRDPTLVLKKHLCRLLSAKNL